MVRPSTSFPRAVRWQQPLAIIVVLSGMLTASTPAAPDAGCVDLDSLPKQEVGNGERIVHLGNASVGHEVTLCPESNPVRRVRFKVRQSNVLLDCGGVVFDGSAGPEGAAVSRALDFDKTVSPAIHNVVVRNCEFHNYAQGIIVAGADIQGAPDEGLANVRLQDIVLNDIGATAVKIGAHNRDSLLERVEIARARTGVYLEAYSSRTTIRDCQFIQNGWSTQSESVDGREAIAIDASSHNVITDSYFYNNKYAGIALYKNCGESTIPREAGANYNIIERNEFYRHDNATRGAAIVIASRQGLHLDDDEDVFVDGTCTDPAIQTVLGPRYRDIARYNVVRRNAFAFNVTAIRVRDSFNHIEGNTFMGETWIDPDDNKEEQAKYDIVADAKLLQDIGEPATGITVIDNVTLTKTSELSGRTFERLYDATMLFANNVDRSYQCVPDSLAPGNHCNGAVPLSRCEVVQDACPARDEYAGFPDFPEYWLATVYGANMIPHRCEERARAIWEWCAAGNEAFTVTTTAFVDNYPVAEASYSGP